MDVITPLNAAQTLRQEGQARHESYLLRVLVAVDIAANVALGGQEDETISTNTALMARKHEVLGVVVSRMLNLFQPDHGAKAAAGDLERAQAMTAKLTASGVVHVE
ncbi:hypothetical protein [Acidipila sp. EB88]|uniref:hypothetical protein n=1 Tax=Acidipila sp. EB88 TaxID=2305226 RepID=UPI000F5FDF9E|nr:hypothetical protein [Acidipila sp. EB88]RRA48229.1 hypothetical protein D1Y84_07945 [Acidipila sp. EB88]